MIVTSTRLVVTCISFFKGEGGGENGLFLMLLFVFVLSIVFNIFDLLIRLEGLLPAVKNDGTCLAVYSWVNITVLVMLLVIL